MKAGKALLVALGAAAAAGTAVALSSKGKRKSDKLQKGLPPKEWKKSSEKDKEIILSKISKGDKTTKTVVITKRSSPEDEADIVMKKISVAVANLPAQQAPAKVFSEERKAPVAEKIPPIENIPTAEEVVKIMQEISGPEEVSAIEDKIPAIKYIPTAEEVVKIMQEISEAKDTPTVREEPTVEEETPVIEEETPVVEEEAPVIEEEAPVTEEEAPVTEEEAPVIEEETPVVEEEAPAVEEETTVIEEEAPVTEEEAPVIEEEAPIIEEEAPIIEEETTVIEEEAPVTEEEAPVIEEETPIIEEEAPAIEEETTVIEEEAPVTEEEAPVIEEETPVIEEETTVIEEETPVIEEETTVIEEEIPDNPELETEEEYSPRVQYFRPAQNRTMDFFDLPEEPEKHDSGEISEEDLFGDLLREEQPEKPPELSHPSEVFKLYEDGGKEDDFDNYADESIRAEQEKNQISDSKKLIAQDIADNIEIFAPLLEPLIAVKENRIHGKSGVIFDWEMQINSLPDNAPVKAYWRQNYANYEIWTDEKFMEKASELLSMLELVGIKRDHAKEILYSTETRRFYGGKSNNFDSDFKLGEIAVVTVPCWRINGEPAVKGEIAKKAPFVQFSSKNISPLEQMLRANKCDNGDVNIPVDADSFCSFDRDVPYVRDAIQCGLCKCAVRRMENGTALAFFYEVVGDGDSAHYPPCTLRFEVTLDKNGKLKSRFMAEKV